MLALFPVIIVKEKEIKVNKEDLGGRSFVSTIVKTHTHTLCVYVCMCVCVYLSLSLSIYIYIYIN